MDSLFLGLSTLLISWITAFLLSALSVYFFIHTRQFESISGWIKRNSPNGFIQQNSRFVLAGSSLVMMGIFLSILMSLSPNQEGLLFSSLRNHLDGSFWNQYSNFADDAIITLGIFLLLVLIPTINQIFSRVCRIIDNLRETKFRVVRIQNLELFTPNQMVGVLIIVSKYVRLTVILALFVLLFTLVFSLYPQTDGLAQSLLVKFSEGISAFWDEVLSFLPNIAALLVIAIITRVVLKLLRFLYDGLLKGKIRFSSIHPEVVEPTYQLIRFLVIAFALVAAFPYIPGSSSPMFRGLSIFVGFLISLGSTSLVTNIIAGIVLTYSRGLKIGDRVKIDENVGDVIDRTLLVIKMKTIKNEIITIPNVIVMQNEIINYSAEARGRGLILHTSVTIGYDEPWRHVEELLIGAALDTGDILRYPKPFVLKTSLDNHYICYELNAFTNNPGRMADIYSDLHQNVLDKFNQADVEIMSPTYFAFRNGQGSTIPRMYSPANGNGNGSLKQKHRSPVNPYQEKTQPLGSRS